MYFPNSALFTWSYRVADWAWEDDVLAKPVAAAVEAAVAAVASQADAASDGSDAAFALLGAVAIVATVAAAKDDLETTFGVDGFDPGAQSADISVDTQEGSIAAATAPVALLEHKDAEPKVESSGLALLQLPAPQLPLFVPLVVESDASESSADSGATGDERAESQAAAASGRWVLKGYKTLHAHIFYFDALREAIADARYEQREFDDFVKEQARKPVERSAVVDAERAALLRK